MNFISKALQIWYHRNLSNFEYEVMRDAVRRKGWLIENLSFRKFINMAFGAIQFVFKTEKMFSWPIIVKIDISPLCNLKCSFCVHAEPNDEEALKKQEFRASKKMTIAQYQRIIDEIKGKSAAVSLYYLGDPLVHPDVDEMCQIARQAGLNVHISTNFSFPLTDERISRLVSSGLTHLTVCVDGLIQEKYQLTRVGGRLDWVLSNLRRVCEYKREKNLIYPKVEVQYIKFQHNLDQLEQAKQLFAEIGIDQVTVFWGKLSNMTEVEPGTYPVFGPKKNKGIPQCIWPHLSMLIKYNGDVIPCCQYRQSMQYSSQDDPLVVGNVFETSVWQVWNSPQYRELRRLVSKPELVESETSLKKSFCYGCSQIFNVDFGPKNLYANTHHFEEVSKVIKKSTS